MITLWFPYKALIVWWQRDKQNLTGLLQRAISLWKNTKLGMCYLIDGERVKVLNRLGGGQFGEVFSGELTRSNKESNIHKMNPKLKVSDQVGRCAIKTVKRQNDKYKEDEELRYVFKPVSL